MAIDHRLNFFRIYLQASDIDDSIPPAEKVVPVSAQFHHVARIYEALAVRQHSVFLAGITERGPRGTDQEGTVVDLDRHRAAPAGVVGWEALEPITACKCDAGFGGSKGMADGGLRI